MTFKMIAAMSLNRVIGKDNDIPWKIPEELQWFKKMTTDHVILMGRKTYESIGRPLPHRISIVLTKRTPLPRIKGVRVINDLKSLNTPPLPPEKIIWIIGGAQLYNLAFPLCSDLYLTLVKQDISGGDTFFPPFEHVFQEKERVADNDRFSIKHYINPSPMPYENL